MRPVYPVRILSPSAPITPIAVMLTRKRIYFVYWKRLKGKIIKIAREIK
jgi:hypothetical protein